MEEKKTLDENLFGLIPVDTQKIKSVFAKYPQVEEVFIYGSRAKGNHKPYSDIDLTFLGNELSQKLLFQIEIDLDELCLPYSFDLSIKETINNPDFLDHIERVGKIFYNKENNFKII